MPLVLYCFSVLSDSSEFASGIIAVGVGGLFALEGLYLFSDLSCFVSVELHPKECIRLPAKFSVEVVVTCLCVAAVCDSHIYTEAFGAGDGGWAWCKSWVVGHGLL